MFRFSKGGRCFLFFFLEGRHRSIPGTTALKLDVDAKDDGLEDVYRLLNMARLDINVKFQGGGYYLDWLSE